MFKENPTISKETIIEVLKDLSDIAKIYEKEDNLIIVDPECDITEIDLK